MKKTHRTRMFALALGVGLVGALPVASAVPAAAAEADSMVCNTILQTTPWIAVDLNDDGNPEVTAPQVKDVELCHQVTTGVTTYPPRWNSCSVGWHVTCVEVRVTIPPAWAGASIDGSLCFTATGVPRQCVPLDSGSTVGPQPRTICIGVDLFGSNACNGSLVAFE